MKKTVQKLFIGAGIGVLCAIVLTLGMKWILPELWINLENRTYDLRYRLQDHNLIRSDESVMEGVRTADRIEDIVIINIDERSMLPDLLGWYGKWPRSYHGEVIAYLKSGNAAVTAFDVQFNDADYGKKETDRIMGIFQDRNRRARLAPAEFSRINGIIREGVNYDRNFVRATRAAGNVIHALHLNDTLNYANRSDYIARTTEKHRLASGAGSGFRLEAGLMETLRRFPVLDGAFPELAQAADRVGLVNVVPDPDGVHRTIPLLLRFRNHAYPAISLQACLKLMNKTLRDVEFVPGKWMDLGRPFHLEKRPDHGLAVSYPGVNGLMIRMLLSSATAVKNLKDGEQVPVTEKIVVARDGAGRIFCEIPAGTVPFPMLRGISGFSQDSLLSIPLNEPRRLREGAPWGIVRSSERLYTLGNIRHEEETIEDIPLNTFLILAGLDLRRAAALKPGESWTVCGNLNVTRHGGRLATEYVLLQGKVLNGLLAFPPSRLDGLTEGKRVYFGDAIRIPMDKHGRMRINYKGPRQVTFKNVSYYDVKAQRVPAEYFCGKIALIGSDAPSMFDIVASPVDQDYPGVEIHATIMANILKNDYMRVWSAQKTFALVLVLCIVIALFSFWVRPLFAIIAVVVLFLGHFVFAFQQFELNTSVAVVQPMLGIFASFVAVIAYRYVTEERDRKFLKATFENYLSPTLIDQMYESKQVPKLGGAEAVCTAYFTDIQGFSTFSEKLGSPTRLVELLNEYLSGMTDILMEHGGTLDKYIGDAIVAVFGAPLHLPDHADKACLTAIGMQKKLEALRAKWKSEGDKWPEIVHMMRMRIGINTGNIVTGNMGSKKRMNYTMMGDPVNLAARLESASKQYGIFTMISNATFDLLGGRYDTRELDKITVMGKTEPVTVYELFDEKGKSPQHVMEIAGLFGEGLALYKNQEWDKAVEIFTKSAKLEQAWRPDQKTSPSRLYIDRCQAFKASPPGADWDGAYKLKSK
jgi:adenylate cyclase